jgi:hypothetical protein
MIVAQLAYYGTRKFIIVFTRSRYWNLSRDSWIQCTSSQHIYLRSHLRLGPSSGLFPSDFWTKFVCEFINLLLLWEQVKFKCLQTKFPGIEMTAFWGIAPCSLVEVDQRFRDSYCLHHQSDVYTAQYPRRLSSSYSPPWEPENSQEYI